MSTAGEGQLRRPSQPPTVSSGSPPLRVGVRTPRAAARVDLEFSSQPIHNAVWELWSLLFAMAVIAIFHRLSPVETTLLSWFVVPVLTSAAIGTTSASSRPASCGSPRDGSDVAGRRWVPGMVIDP